MSKEIWEEVTITWNCRMVGLATDISVADQSGNNPMKLKLHKLEAVLYPGPQGGQLNITVTRGAVVLTEEYQSVIWDRLREIVEKLRKGNSRSFNPLSLEKKEGRCGEYELSFNAKDKLSFGIAALLIVSAIHNGLGIVDLENRILKDFIITQETFVKVGASWIRFSEWLRTSEGVGTHRVKDRVRCLVGK